MKILILGCKEYPLGSGKGFDAIPSGGIERYAENISKELAKQSEMEILIITRRFPGTPSDQTLNNIKIYRVGWMNGFFLRNPTFNLQAFFLALRLKFDLVLGFGVFASFFGVILSFLKKVPIIHRNTGFHHLESQYNRLISKFLYVLEILAYRFHGEMIFASEKNKNNFKRTMGFIPKRNHVVPSGVDMGYFSPVAISHKGPLQIVTVSRLTEAKGIQDVMKSLAMLRHEIEFSYSIVGDGPYRSTLERMVNEYSLSRRVIFEGSVSPERVVNSLWKANLFVLPSRSEGLPLSLLEAMACGLPCIVTDIGLPIEHEKTGLIVPPKNTRAMAQAISRLSTDQSLREALGRSGREYVIAKHSWAKCAEEIYRLCQNSTQKRHKLAG